MKVAFELDKSVEEIHVNIIDSNYSKKTMNLIEYIENFENNQNVLSIKHDDSIHFIAQEDIELLEVNGGEVTIVTASDEIVTINRLYKLMEKLNMSDFIQVSKSSVININALVKLETYFSGTMLAILKCGRKVNVTRTYLVNLKQKLNI